MANLHDLRRDYASEVEHRTDYAADPITQFDRWFQAALAHQVPEANGATLSTVDETLQPTARIVLLKYYDENGFVFFTNFNSRKGIHLMHNPKASLLFWWSARVQQIAIEGQASVLDDQHADAYFATRSRSSQLAAWASLQSQELASRDVLLKRYEQYEKQFSEEDTIPRPPFWGGYVLKPERVEFWHGVKARLHDRFCYQRAGTGEGWVLKRISP